MQGRPNVFTSTTARVSNDAINFPTICQERVVNNKKYHFTGQNRMAKIRKLFFVIINMQSLVYFQVSLKSIRSFDKIT